ncbi:GntR family transcriptional regulator [Paenibacillus swuensis]|uniref:GntR family transcriptional regulator n=1 Tax=Paenibacillus swuensis TaxID=1178515 RepID=A0A172TEI6_9BACL|nr:PLP-dependent aminotransferase family protein [Paenibacillus swuensis]ANE45458.1 GntR family transcriptional regulator [Paenibacillus swuensis]
MRKYAQIICDMEERIQQGFWKPGDKLTSIRTLSADYNCSMNTVIKAYSELERKHRIYAVPNSGYYVVEGGSTGAVDNGNTSRIDFLSAGPDKEAMPYRDFQHCMNQAIERYQEEMFTYSEPQGLYSLRQQLARHLQDLQVFTVPERIWVVSGSQQALNLFVSLPFPNGRTNICLEQPTHMSFIQSVQHHDVEAYGIEVSGAGVDLERLEHIFAHHQIKFFYMVSRFHNPTGHSYTNEDKRRIVELARQYDVYIIEDDYMGDLDVNLKQDPLYAYEPSGRVIYVKSFSKVMLPGLRLGLAVLPEAMNESFRRAKFAADLHTPLLMQGALEIYLKSGMFQAHIQRMRELYRGKAILLQEAYKKHLPAVSALYSEALSGFYSTIELPRGIKAKELIQHLMQENVEVDEVEKMFLPAFAKDTMIRISVSQVREDLIEQGIRNIAEGIRGLCERKHEVVVFK